MYAFFPSSDRATNEARRIAANTAKLPELVRKVRRRSPESLKGKVILL
jgi:hypothetical protein